MLVFILVQLLGYVGLIGAKRSATAMKHAGRIEGVSAAWAVTMSFGLSWSFGYAVISVMRCSETIIVGTALTCSLLLLVYVSIGLGKAWPVHSKLGFPRADLWKSAVGVAVGCVLVTALSLHVGATVMHAPSWLWGYIIVSGVVPISIMEEAVFRGRVMEVLSSRIRSPETTLVFQALMFAGFHMICVPLSSKTGYGTPIAVRKFSIVLLTAYIYGVLRQRSGSLWAPLGAHITYNLLAMLSNLG